MTAQSNTRSRAFWIAPDGTIGELAATSHVAALIADPARFGLRRDEILAVYRQEQEPLGVEGRARQHLLRRVIAAGWIRVRGYPDAQWSITLQHLGSAERQVLARWAVEVGAGSGFDRHLPVVVSELATGVTHHLRWQDLAAEAAGSGAPLPRGG